MWIVGYNETTILDMMFQKKKKNNKNDLNDIKQMSRCQILTLSHPPWSK
jgi:hypothetical protein